MTRAHATGDADNIGRCMKHPLWAEHRPRPMSHANPVVLGRRCLCPRMRTPRLREVTAVLRVTAGQHTGIDSPRNLPKGGEFTATLCLTEEVSVSGSLVNHRCCWLRLTQETLLLPGPWGQVSENERVPKTTTCSRSIARPRSLRRPRALRRIAGRSVHAREAQLRTQYFERLESGVRTGTASTPRAARSRDAAALSGPSADTDRTAGHVFG